MILWVFIDNKLKTWGPYFEGSDILMSMNFIDGQDIIIKKDYDPSRVYRKRFTDN